MKNLALAAFLALSASGCVLPHTHYIDPKVQLLSRDRLPKVEHPRRAIVLFEFKTEGLANAPATKDLRARAVAAAEGSGMFSTVSATASAGSDADVLTISIDDVGGDSNKFHRSMTSSTFGLVGEDLNESYICAVSFTRGKTTLRSTQVIAMHTAVGTQKLPPGATTLEDATAADLIVDQLVWRALKDLHEQNAFDAE